MADLAAWWEKWWAEDYTWAGLAKKPWQGWSVTADGHVVETKSGARYGTAAHSSSPASGGGVGAADGGGSSQSPPRPSGPLPSQAGGDGAGAPPLIRDATLQDYWRTDPATGRLRGDEELIAAGELIVNGIAAPLGAAAPSPPTQLSTGNVAGGEGAAAPIRPAFHIIHLPTHWPDGAATGKADWAPHDLNEFLIPRLAAAGETIWAGKWYEHNLLGPDRRAQLNGAVLLAFDIESLRPVDAQTLSLTAQSALFLWDCACSNARFLGDFWCDRATFIGYAKFDSATFTGNAWFDSATFTGGARFHGATFTGFAAFTLATFTGAASFGNATFTVKASFRSATFMGTAWFMSATFTGVADFGSTSFRGESQFNRVAFLDHAEFGSATFTGDAWFYFATFSADAEFKRTTITTGSFDNARISGVANFSDATISTDVGFDGTRFGGLHGPARLAGAVWWALAVAGAAALYASSQTTGWAYWVSIGAAGLFGAALLVWSIIGGHICADGEKLKALEHSFRVLKRQTGAARNIEGEALASALELKASRMRLGHNLPWSIPVKLAERLFSVSYELFGDYGRSVWRPAFYLAFFTLTFAGLIWAWEGGGLKGPQAPFWTSEKHAVASIQQPFDPDFLEALSFSASRVFPFGPWAENKAPGDRKARCSFTARHLALDHCQPDGVALPTATALEGHRFVVRMVAVGQSLLAIVLAFLFALAVRRRFQIN